MSDEHHNPNEKVINNRKCFHYKGNWLPVDEDGCENQRYIEYFDTVKKAPDYEEMVHLGYKNHYDLDEPFETFLLAFTVYGRNYRDNKDKLDAIQNDLYAAKAEAVLNKKNADGLAKELIEIKEKYAAMEAYYSNIDNNPEILQALYSQNAQIRELQEMLNQAQIVMNNERSQTDFEHNQALWTKENEIQALQNKFNQAIMTTNNEKQQAEIQYQQNNYQQQQALWNKENEIQALQNKLNQTQMAMNNERSQTEIKHQQALWNKDNEIMQQRNKYMKESYEQQVNHMKQISEKDREIMDLQSKLQQALNDLKQVEDKANTSIQNAFNESTHKELQFANTLTSFKQAAWNLIQHILYSYDIMLNYIENVKTITELCQQTINTIYKIQDNNVRSLFNNISVPDINTDKQIVQQFAKDKLQDVSP